MTAVVEPIAGTPEGTPAIVADPAAAAGTPAAAADAGSPAPVVPAVEYVLALPEKSLLDPQVVTRVTEFAKANGLTPAAAQAVLAAHDAEVGETLKVLDAANAPGGPLYQARVAELNAAALAHPDLGGGDARKLTDVTLRSQLVLNQFGPELKPLLDKSGDGSRPELLLLLTRVAAAIGEKALVVPDTTGLKAPPLTDAQAMYPDMYPPKA